jgi:hypothetical protein
MKLGRAYYQCDDENAQSAVFNNINMAAMRACEA